MGAKSRRKGKSGELELVHLAQECGFPSARRGGPIQGDGEERLADLDGVPLLWGEGKRYKRTPVTRLLRELLKTERLGQTSVLFWRDDGGEWMAGLDARECLNRHAELLALRSEVVLLRAQVRAMTPSIEEDIANGARAEDAERKAVGA